ncbi:uncharacterized protein HD556DRAFT_1527034 [Suillus plorans]|uniref:DUF6533 domain-containing protein n=1 Tax=Suillus plorans TaxID=116603 RepID=A0A9P7ASK0_9AGAM|nr:uncharacterized protein HD556DRAFT_1527034 [Suillus plorans]KAG1794587.1 hypothetical protein HD556DRAFT_1527034 [Suillus plorans]
MEYSTDHFAAARSLQLATYIHISMATFWTYDYACSLHEEWKFLLRSRWGKMKALYIVTRYLPFIFLATDLYLYCTPNENPSKCRVLENTESGLGIVLVIVSESISRSPHLMCLSDLIHPVFFILRTYVLWHKNIILLTAMLSTFFVSSQSNHHTQASGRCISQIVLATAFSIAFTTGVPAAYATSGVPGITGCYQSSTSFQYFIPFLLLSVFELGLMVLTLIRAIQNWRINSSRLYVALVNHNISYYACSFRELTHVRAVFLYSSTITVFPEVLSLTNVFASLLLQYSYQNILYDFEFMTLAILATRMHLHLWQTDQRAHGSGTLMHIPMSDVPSVNSTA